MNLYNFYHHHLCLIVHFESKTTKHLHTPHVRGLGLADLSWSIRTSNHNIALKKINFCSKGHFKIYMNYKLCFGIYVGVDIKQIISVLNLCSDWKISIWWKDKWPISLTYWLVMEQSNLSPGGYTTTFTFINSWYLYII